MKIIALDASGWLTALDFYDALLARLGAPHWHGTSMDALIDSMIYGNMNAIEAPYRILATDLDKAKHEAFDALAVAFACLAQAGAQAHFQGNEAWLEITKIHADDIR